MKSIRLPTHRQTGIFLTITIILGLSNFGFGQQIGPGIGAGTQDARRVISESAQALRKLRNVTYRADYQGTGAFSTRAPSVTGEVAIERLNPENPLKAKFAARGQFSPTGSSERQNFHTTFDGTTIYKLRPQERALMKKTLVVNNPSERKLGFVTSFFGGGAFQLMLFEWIEDDPLNIQSQAEVADYEGRAVVNETLCHVVYVEYVRSERKIRERWFFGIKDNLPRKLESLVADDKGRPGAYVLAISGLKTNNVFNGSLFRIKLPVGYTVKLYEPPKPPMLLPIDTPAPDWKLFDSLNREHSLLDYRGKVVIMDFWATWCGPCIQAMPDVEKLYNKFKSVGVEVFGINVWEESNALAYFKQKGFNYTLLLNGEEIAKAYHVSSLPTLYIIGIDGKIIYHTTGSHKEVETVLKQYLKSLETK